MGTITNWFCTRDSWPMKEWLLSKKALPKNPHCLSHSCLTSGRVIFLKHTVLLFFGVLNERCQEIVSTVVAFLWLNPRKLPWNTQQRWWNIPVNIDFLRALHNSCVETKRNHLKWGMSPSMMHDWEWHQKEPSKNWISPVSVRVMFRVGEEGEWACEKENLDSCTKN